MKRIFVVFAFLQISLFAEGNEVELLRQYESLFSTLPHWNKKAATIQRFEGGCTNENYLLITDLERYFVRVGSPTRKLLDLNFTRECTITKLAAELNLAPPILAADLAQEILILPFIESHPVNLHQEKSLLEVLGLLKKLHQSKTVLPFSATPEEIISSYLIKIEELKIPLSPTQKELVNRRPKPDLGPLVPCHLDLKGQNILDDGMHFWIIDWEYGAMSDPLFDLASLASADSFTDEEMDKLLDLYIEVPSLDVQQRFWQFRILADLRWALWALIQMHTSSFDLPFEQWADELFDEVAKRLNYT